MSYAKSLRNTLKDKDDSLFNLLRLIEPKAKSVLTYTASKFPYYTPHDFSHSLNVEEILNYLIPDEIKPKMNPHEIFLLLIAAWLHDWGMVGAPEEETDEIRKTHHIRTEDNFEKMYDKVLLSSSEGQIVGRICRGHREEDLHDSKYDDIFYGNNILIRIRFLAALLRIADECDVTANRTPEIIYCSLRPEGASEEEFKKHLPIIGIGKSTPYKLQLNGVAYTPKGVQVIQGVRDKIQKQIDSVKAILGSYGVTLEMIEAHPDAKGFINKPIAFELDRKSVVSLLIGNSLYSRKDCAIRELLQNAIDTCRLRKILDSSYEPIIELEYDNEKLSFEDNGLGMSFDDAYEYFSRKGSSFYVADNLKDFLKGAEFNPISKFGIGVLSYFMVAERMIVETKKDGCSPCRFTISDLSEGWTYEEGSRTKAGTKVTLFLNDNGKSIDVLKSLRRFAKNVSIPILVTNPLTRAKERFTPSWNGSMLEIQDAITGKTNKSLKARLVFETSSPDMDVKCFAYDPKTFGYFVLDDRVFLAKNGIYIGNFDFMMGIDPYDAQWVILVDLKSDILDLTVSREEIVENEKYLKFLEAFYQIFVDNILAEYDGRVKPERNLENCIDFSTKVIQFLGEHIYLKVNSNEVGLFRKINNRRTFPVLVSRKLTYLNWNQIISGHFTKILHYTAPLFLVREHVETMSKLLLPHIKKNEALVFDFGPFLRIGKGGPFGRAPVCVL